MKLHLPSGLRKALLACLAAVALPTASIPTTIASASGIAAVFLMTSQRASAEFKGPEEVEYTKGEQSDIDDDTEFEITMDTGDNVLSITCTFAEGTDKSSINLKIEGTTHNNGEAKLVGDLSGIASLWLTGVGMFNEGGAFLKGAPQTIYVNGAQLNFSSWNGNEQDLTSLECNFSIGQSSADAPGNLAGAALRAGKNVKTTGSLTLQEDATIGLQKNTWGNAAGVSITFEIGGEVSGSGHKLTVTSYNGAENTLTFGNGGTLGSLDLQNGVTLSLKKGLKLDTGLSIAQAAKITLTGGTFGAGKITAAQGATIVLYESTTLNFSDIEGKLTIDLSTRDIHAPGSYDVFNGTEYQAWLNGKTDGQWEGFLDFILPGDWENLQLSLGQDGRLTVSGTYHNNLAINAGGSITIGGNEKYEDLVVKGSSNLTSNAEGILLTSGSQTVTFTGVLRQDDEDASFDLRVGTASLEGGAKPTGGTLVLQRGGELGGTFGVCDQVTIQLGEEGEEGVTLSVGNLGGNQFTFSAAGENEVTLNITEGRTEQGNLGVNVARGQKGNHAHIGEHVTLHLEEGVTQLVAGLEFDEGSCANLDKSSSFTGTLSVGNAGIFDMTTAFSASQVILSAGSTVKVGGQTLQAEAMKLREGTGDAQEAGVVIDLGRNGTLNVDGAISGEGAKLTLNGTGTAKFAGGSLEELAASGVTLTLSRALALEKGGSIGEIQGKDWTISLGHQAELVLGMDNVANLLDKISLKENADEAWLELTGKQSGSVEFKEGFNVRFHRAASGSTSADRAGNTDINFTGKVTVKGDVEITEGTYVKFTKGGSADIEGKLSGEGSLVFWSGDNGQGEKITLRQGGSIGELNFQWGDGVCELEIGGDLEVGSLVDATDAAQHTIKRYGEGTDPVHFILRKEAGTIESVDALVNEFTGDTHKGLTIADDLGVGIATAGVVKLQAGGTMTRDFKFKGLGEGNTLKLDDATTFEHHFTLENATVELAGGTLNITDGLVLQGQNTLLVTDTAAEGPALTFGKGAVADFVSGQGLLEIELTLSALEGMTSGELQLFQAWNDAWGKRVSVSFADGAPFDNAHVNKQGKLVWDVITDPFSGKKYENVAANGTSASISGNTVVTVANGNVSLTFAEGTRPDLKLQGTGGDTAEYKMTGGVNFEGLASLYLAGNGFFTEDGSFGEKGPVTVYVKGAQFYINGWGTTGTKALSIESDFVIGGSTASHGVTYGGVNNAAIGVGKQLTTTGGLTLKEDATIGFLSDAKTGPSTPDGGGGSDGSILTFGKEVSGSTFTLTLTSQAATAYSGNTRKLVLNGGGTLGCIDSSTDTGLIVELGGTGKVLTLEQGGRIAGTLNGNGGGLKVSSGTLTVGTMSGTWNSLELGEKAKMTVTTRSATSLSSLTLGAESELGVGSGDITLGGLHWFTGARLNLSTTGSHIVLSGVNLSDPEQTQFGTQDGGLLTINLSKTQLDAVTSKEIAEFFQDFGEGWENNWKKYFRFTVDGAAAGDYGYVFTVDSSGKLTWTKSSDDYVIPPDIGPLSGEYKDKQVYKDGGSKTDTGTFAHSNPDSVKYTVTLLQGGKDDNTLQFTFAPNQLGEPAANLWVEVLAGNGFTLDANGLNARTLLVRGMDTPAENAEVVLDEVGSTKHLADLEGLYVEGDFRFNVKATFSGKADLYIHTSEWDSTDGDKEQFHVGDNVTTTGTLYAGDFAQSPDSGARVGVAANKNLTVNTVQGTNLQLWESGGLTITNGDGYSNLSGKLQIYQTPTLTLQSGVFEVGKGSRATDDSSLAKLSLAEGASFRMNSGTLYATEIEMTSNSSLQFTLHDGEKETAILELGEKGFSTGDAKASVVLWGDSGADFYQLFGSMSRGQSWWGDWYAGYVKRQKNIEFFLAAPEMAGKQVKLSYDGKIHFVDDMDELTFTWDGSADKDGVLDWEVKGSAEWKKLGGSWTVWSKPSDYERDARLTGELKATYTVNLRETVTTGDLSVEGGATFTLTKEGGSELQVNGLLSTTRQSTLAIGKGVTVKPLHYVGDGTILLQDGGTLDLNSCAADEITLALQVDDEAVGTGGTLVIRGRQTAHLDGVAGLGDLRVSGDDSTLDFMSGGQVGSLQQKGDGFVNIRVGDAVAFERESSVAGEANFESNAGIRIGGDLSVGLLTGGAQDSRLRGVSIVDSRRTPEDTLTLTLTGCGRSATYYGDFTLGSQNKDVDLNVRIGSGNRQTFAGGTVAIWGDVALTDGELEFNANNVADIYGRVSSGEAAGSALRLSDTRLTIHGDENAEAGHLKTLDFTGTAQSMLSLGGDLEVSEITYTGLEAADRATQRVMRADDATADTVFLLLTESDAAGEGEAETLQDFRNEYGSRDDDNDTYPGVTLGQGVGIGWAGEGELRLKGDGGTFTTPFKLKRGTLNWTEGTQTMTDFTAAKDAQMTVTAGELTLEQFHGELGTLTLNKGAEAGNITTLRVGYGTLKASSLVVTGDGKGDAKLEVELSKGTLLDFGSITGALQVQLDGWNDLADQVEGYQLFAQDEQWNTLWESLGDNWTDHLTFLDDNGKELDSSLVELTEDGVVKLKLVDGDLYWGGGDSDSALTWGETDAWHTGEGGTGLASFATGNSVHLEGNDASKPVTLGSDVIARSMDVQGQYTLTGDEQHTLRVQEGLTVGEKGELTIEENTQVVVKGYVEVKGSITLKSDLVIGGNIGGGGKVAKSDEVGDDVDVYVLWDNGGNGAITWEGTSWSTFVPDDEGEGPLGTDVGYGKTGKTDLVIYGEATLERNFKGAQGTTTFKNGVMLDGNKLVVGEGARIIVEGTDGLKAGTGDKIELGAVDGEKGTIEITVGDTLSNITSSSGAELHVSVAEGGDVQLSGLDLQGGLVMENGGMLRLTGTENKINGLDATRSGQVVAADGSTTTLNGDVNIANGLRVDGTITGTSDMDVRGGLNGGESGSLTAGSLTLTYGAGEVGTFNGNLTLTKNDKTTGDLVLKGDGEYSGQNFGGKEVKVGGNLTIDGGVLRLVGDYSASGSATPGSSTTLTVQGDSVTSTNGGRLAVGRGVQLSFENIGDDDYLELNLEGFLQADVGTDGYALFAAAEWKEDFLEHIHLVGYTEDADPNKNRLKLMLDKSGKVVYYNPVAELEGVGDYQALTGNMGTFDWKESGQRVWTWDMSVEKGEMHNFNEDAEKSDRTTVFAVQWNGLTTITVNGSIMLEGDMYVLCGKDGLGGTYLFEMSGTAAGQSVTVTGKKDGGKGLVIGEDTYVTFHLTNANISFLTELTTVKNGATLEIIGQSGEGGSKNFGTVTVEKGGEVIIRQTNAWAEANHFEGAGKVTVDLGSYSGNPDGYDGSRHILTFFTQSLVDEGGRMDHVLSSFEFRHSVLQLSGNAHMSSFKNLKDVIVGEQACLLFDVIPDLTQNGWGSVNERNINIHLSGTGHTETEITNIGNAVYDDAAFSFFTHDNYNGQSNNGAGTGAYDHDQTQTTPWSFTLDGDATMRIGRDQSPHTHTLRMGGTYDGGGHTLSKIGSGVLEFGYESRVKKGSTGEIDVQKGTLKLSYADNSPEGEPGLSNYAVRVKDGGTLDLSRMDFRLGSLDVGGNEGGFITNANGSTITICGYGEGNQEYEAAFGTSHVAIQKQLEGTSWVMDWENGTQTVGGTTTLNSVEVKVGTLVLAEDVKELTGRAALSGEHGVLQLQSDVTIDGRLEASGGTLELGGSLTLQQGMHGTLDQLTIEGSGYITLRGGGVQTLSAKSVTATGRATIEIDVSSGADTQVRLDFGSIEGQLHLNLTGWSKTVTEYQLFENNSRFRELWASAPLNTTDGAWWESFLDIYVDSPEFKGGVYQMKLMEDGKLVFLPFDGLIWEGSSSTTWSDKDKDAWKDPQNTPAGKDVLFNNQASGADKHVVQVDGVVTPAQVKVYSGEYVFEQEDGTTGGLYILKEEKAGQSNTGSGALIVGGDKNEKARLTLALKNKSVPEIQLKNNGTLVLADDGALTDEDPVRGNKKTKLRFLGGTLEYSAYTDESGDKHKLSPTFDVSEYVAGMNEADGLNSTDAVKVKVVGGEENYKDGVTWGSKDKEMTSGVELALDGTGLELTADEGKGGTFTLSWEEKADPETGKGKTYGDGVDVNVGEKATLVLDVATEGDDVRADLADTFSGAGTLAVAGGGKLKFSGNSTKMGNIELQNNFDLEIAGDKALGGEGTQLTLQGGTLSSQDDTPEKPTKVQAGTVTAAGDITVDGNITFTGELKDGEGKNSSFTAAADKTAGFSGDISAYTGTLKTADDTATWSLTDEAAKGEVQAGLEGNGTFDFEVKDQLTLHGKIGSEGNTDQLTLQNSGRGNLVVASGTDCTEVKLNAGKGTITLGESTNDVNDPITWKGTHFNAGDIVLANVTLGEAGTGFNLSKATITVNTSVSPDKTKGGTVDVNGLAADTLSGITINQHGQLKGVTGTYKVGKDHTLNLRFADENEKNAEGSDKNKPLIEGKEKDGQQFTLDLSEAGDNLQFAFDAGIIAQLRAVGEDAKTLLHLLSGGTITKNGVDFGESGMEVDLEKMKDQIAQLLWCVEAFIKEEGGEYYLELTGGTSNLYVVMDREHSDLDTVDDMSLFEGTTATAVLDGKTLTLQHDGESKGEGKVTLENLVGTEGTGLELQNTTDEDGSRFNVTLDNTHFDKDTKDKRKLTDEEKEKMQGQDTTFEGSIHGTAGVDVTKTGKGTLTVGDDYQLDDGTTKIEEGKLVLKGDENKMEELKFAYKGAPGTGNAPESKSEDRGLVLDGGAEGSTTTVGSITESGSYTDEDNNIELDNAGLVLKGESTLEHTTITGNEEKGGGSVTMDGPDASLTFDGVGNEEGKGNRLSGVDVNVKDGGSLTLSEGATMDVGDVTLSGTGLVGGDSGTQTKKGSSLDIGKGESHLGTLNGDADSTLRSADGGELHVGKDGTGGKFSGTLDSSDGTGAAGKLVVEDRADFTLDNVTTTNDKEKAWNVQVGTDPEKAGGSSFTVDTSKGGSVTFGDVDLGSGNTTTFVVDPNKSEGYAGVTGDNLTWGSDSKLVLEGSGVYRGDSLTLGDFERLEGETGDLDIELKGSAFFLKDGAKVEKRDGKLVVEFEEATDNKFSRLLPDMHKNAQAGADLVWGSLMDRQNDLQRFFALLDNPNSDYMKMAEGLISLYEAGDKEGLEKALTAVAGSSIATLGPALVQDLHRQLTSIRNRTTTMAGEVTYDSYDQLPMWHAWVNAEGGYHKMDADGLAPGYSLNNWGGTVGADVDISPATTLGFALTAMYGDLKPDAADAATGNLDTMYLSALLRTTSGAWIHTFVMSGGIADIGLDRTVNVGGTSYRTQGSTDGYAVGAMYEVGYTRLMNREGTMALQPVFNVEIRHAAIKGYEEKGSDAGLKVDEIKQDVVTFGIGARIQAMVGENAYNRTSILEGRLLIKGDVGDTTGISKNGIIGDKKMAEVESAEVGAVGVEAGIGITIPLGTDSSMFMDASAEMRSGWTSFNATVGYRVNF